MSRHPFPDDPGNYPENEPTQYANYGGTGGQAYSEYGPPAGHQPAPTGYGHYQAPVAPPPPPWHQRPAFLVGLGVLTAALLALLVYAVVKFTNSGNTPSPGATSSSVTAPSSSSAPVTSSASRPVPTEQSTAQPSTSSVAPPPPPPPTTTVAPTTSSAPTTTETPTPSTTTSISTSVTTVTETTTRPVFTFPTLPRPTPREQTPAG
ncbi:MAG: hypothetical protein ACKOQ4_16620 [Mycobacterium sp.]